MPHNKSCKKRLLTSQKQNERNRQNRTMMRAKIKVYRAGIEQTPAEEKTASLTAMYSLIDTQARKGLMPKKRAARLKSRMAAAAAK
ncbi:MAG: 30S ribosomal protein S20 [Candidatus Krumholzibacteria bacterium]|nr:30S ribosomal protein S20 [Candidatus Krumholzibacteria bacterium]